MRHVFGGLGWLSGSPWRSAGVLFAWAIITALIFAAAPSLGDVVNDDNADFLPTASEARQALVISQEKFPSPGLPGITLVHRPSGITEADRALAGEVFDYLSAGEFTGFVEATLPPADIVEGDGMVRTLSIVSIFEIGGNLPLFAEYTTELRSHFQSLLGADDELVISFTGPAGIFADLASTFSSFDFRVTLLTIILVFAILLLVYRSPVMPVLALLGVGWTLATAQFLSALAASTFDLPISSQITALMSVLVFGAGTDYTIFVVARYREELRRQGNRWSAMATAVARLGPAISSSGGTTIVVMALLLLASFGSFRGMGPTLGMAIFVTVCAGLTLIPAIVVLAGRWVFWPVSLERAIRPSTLWRRVADWTTKKPWATLLAALVVLGSFALGNLQLEQTFDQVASLPDGTDSKIGFEILAESGTTGSAQPGFVYYQLPTGSVNDHLPALAQISSQLEARVEIARVFGPTRPFATVPQRAGEEFAEFLDSIPPPLLGGITGGPAAAGPPDGSLAPGADPALGQSIATLAAGQRYVSPEKSTAYLEFELAANPGSVEAIDQIPALRTAIRQLTATTSLADVNPIVGGQTAINYDSREAINRDTLLVIPLGYLMIFAILVLVLRSPVAATYLALSVFVSLLASLGIAVFMFEYVFDHSGVGSQNVLWAFIFLTALGADYNILLITRLREECAGSDVASATRRAVASTGGVITSAGIILAGTFLVLTTFPLEPIVQIGLTVSIGILIDTFIVRTVLVPSIIMLLGKWNWWPTDPTKPVAPAVVNTSNI